MRRTNEQIIGLLEDDENFLLCPHCNIYVSVVGNGKCPLCGMPYKDGEWLIEKKESKKAAKEAAKEEEDLFDMIHPVTKGKK